MKTRLAGYLSGIALAAASTLLVPAAAQAGGPGLDVRATKNCQLDPAKGPTAIVCWVDVLNNGSIPTPPPITITDVITAPAGTLFTGSPGSSFGCSAPSGPVPAVLTCSGNHSLAVGTGSGSSGSTFMYFTLPPTGGVFSNCATAVAGANAATGPDTNPRNNTNICARIIVPSTVTTKVPDLNVKKDCQKGANRSLTCRIRISNPGPGASIAPMTISDTLSPILPGTIFTGSSGNVSCQPGMGPLVGSVNCQYLSPIPAGQFIDILLSFSFAKAKDGTFEQRVKFAQGGAVAEANQANNVTAIKVTIP